MTVPRELLEDVRRTVGTDAAATARLEAAPDEAAFLGILGEIAREKGFRLDEVDLRAVVERPAEESAELSCAQLESVAGGNSARDRRKAGLDNIQKFLDILRGMNPRV